MIQKKFKVNCPTGMNQSWGEFPWDRYPGGVDVTFAFVEGKCLYLAKEGRYCHVLPMRPLKRGQVLADLLAELLPGTGGSATVEASHDDGVTLRVLVVVPSGGNQLGGFMKIENSPLLLSGYVSGDKMAPYVARVLDWPEDQVNEYLPLPQAVLAEAA
jgi:hypothetical protein